MSEIVIQSNAVPVQVPGQPTLPVSENSPMAIDPTIDKLSDQAYGKAHEDWLSMQNRQLAGDANVAEQTRVAYLIDRANLALAGDILAQRSSQAQPQQGGTVINPGSVAAGS